MKHPIALLALALSCAAAQAANAVQPKYIEGVTPLSQDHAYIQKNAAPDYWAISPFYLPQQDLSACSVASMAMAMNAARRLNPLTKDDKLITQPSILQKVGNKIWSVGHGLTLDQLGDVAREAAQAYEFPGTKVDVYHAENTSGFKKLWLSALRDNEKSANDLILINFDQGTVMHDSPAGHIAPLGAYDAKTDRVLVMDPDREWYEPYWAKSDALLQAMATQDSTSSKSRGFVWIHFGKAGAK